MKKQPKGYRVRLGPGIGYGKYYSTIQAPDGFMWHKDCRDREEAIEAAWFHFNQLQKAKI